MQHVNSWLLKCIERSASRSKTLVVYVVHHYSSYASVYFSMFNV